MLIGNLGSLTVLCCHIAALCADGRQPQGPALDSARQNLASTFVNAFVNSGFGQDKLVTVSSEAAGSDTGGCSYSPATCLPTVQALRTCTVQWLAPR